MMLASSMLAPAAQLVPAHADLVPANPELIVSLRNLEEPYTQFQASSLGKALRAHYERPAYRTSDEYLQLEARLEAIRTGPANLNLWPDQLFTAVIDQVDLYLIKPEVFIEMVAVITTKDATIPARIMTQLRADAEQARGVSGGFTADTVDQFPVAGWEATALPAFKMYMASKDRVLVWATSSDALQSALLNSGRDFLRSEYFQSYASGLPRPAQPENWFYGDPARLAAMMNTTLPGWAGNTISTVGGDKVAGVLEVSPAAMGLTAFIPNSAMEPIDRRYALAAPPPGELPVFNFFPASVPLAWGTNALDAVTLMDKGLEALEAAPNVPLDRDSVEEQLTNSRSMYGFDIRLDLLANLGPDFGIAIRELELPEPGALAQVPQIDLLMAVGIRDADRYGRVMAQLEGMFSQPPSSASASPMLKQQDLRGRPLMYFDLPALAGSNLQPCYYLTEDNFLLLAMRPSVIQEALEQRASAGTSLSSMSWPPGPGSAPGDVSTRFYVQLEDVQDVIRQNLSRLTGNMNGEERAALQTALNLLDAVEYLTTTTSYTREGRLQQFLLAPQPSGAGANAAQPAGSTPGG